MARPSNKTPEAQIAELEAKLAKVRENAASEKYVNSPILAPVIQNRNNLDTALAEAKQGLFSSVPAFNLSMRAQSTRARLAEIESEAVLSEVTIRYHALYEPFLNSLISQAIDKLGKGEKEEDIEAWISKRTAEFNSENSALWTEFQNARSEYQLALKEREDSIQAKKDAIRNPRGRQASDTSEVKPDAKAIVLSILGK